MGGGGKEGRSYRSRTQRKHFKQSRENVWKRSKSDPSSAENPTWQPFATQNPSFDEYYKVRLLTFYFILHSYVYCSSSFVLD